MLDQRHFEIGTREQWGQEGVPFGLSPIDLRQHLYIIGKSGTGKSTVQRSLIRQALEGGYGIGVIDPHGTLALEALDDIPPQFLDRVVYFDPADSEHPMAWNVLRSGSDPHLVASGIVGALKSIWRDSWGPRLEYILYATIAALLECRNVSFLAIQRMLTDAHYRAWVVKQVKDPALRSFWDHEFANYDRKFLQEAVAPIQNKVGQLLLSPLLRNILGQVRNRLDVRRIMDEGQIFIANLSKGRLGEDKSNLMGALLIAQFHQAAMARADMPESDRKDFRLFVDEFQSFGSDSIASILSEARKYRLSLVLSHQYVEQLRPEIRQAVFGNAGSIIAFRVGQADAELLEREFGHAFQAQTFTRLSNYHVLCKLVTNGEHLEPFAGKTLPPRPPRRMQSERVIKHSRYRHATPRAVAEDRIRRWFKLN
jgi:hypothetical protein